MSETTEKKNNEQNFLAQIFWPKDIGRLGLTRPTNVQDIFNVVDAKNSALLTHVSIMMAVSTVLLTVGKKSWLVIFYSVEIIGYISIAIICLLGLLPSTLSEDGEYKDAGLRRVRLFRLSSMATVFLSALLVLAIGYEAISGRLWQAISSGVPNL